MNNHFFNQICILINKVSDLYFAFFSYGVAFFVALIFFPKHFDTAFMVGCVICTVFLVYTIISITKRNRVNNTQLSTPTENTDTTSYNYHDSYVINKRIDRLNRLWETCVKTGCDEGAALCDQMINDLDDNIVIPDREYLLYMQQILKMCMKTSSND